MRLDAHLTGTQLASEAGWRQPKVSKLENGQQTPSHADLEAWARASGQPETIPELVAALQSLEEQYVEHRRMFRNGLPSKQVAIAEIEAATTFTCNFETCFVPGLLQTADYARYRLSEGEDGDVERGFARSEEELDEAVAGRMVRQQVLYRPGKRFHFVLTEAALRYLVCPVEVLADQLRHLRDLTTLATIRIGILPFSKPIPVGPIHGFYIYDDERVYVELFTAEMKIISAGEIAAYQRVFTRLADAAVYGDEARSVISSVLDTLSSS